MGALILAILLAFTTGHSMIAMEHSKRKQEELNCDLFVAIGNMNLEKTEELLIAGANANATNRLGATVLMHAAGNNYKRISQLLIKHGAQVNTRRENGETALYYAIKHGHEEMCKFLLVNGANPDDKSEHCPALLLAADLGFFSVCKILLDHNADLAAQDWLGNTALMHAARKRWISGKCLSVAWGTRTTLEKICLLFLRHQKRLNKAILALLIHWKINNNDLYRQRCVLMPYLENLLSKDF